MPISECQSHIDILNEHGAEQLIKFPTSENILDLRITTTPGQFIHKRSPDKL